MDFPKYVLQTELGYSAWATRCLLAACEMLTPAELSRDLHLSHHSVLGTLSHTYGSERFWMECLLADQLPPLSEIGRPGPSASLAELESAWPGVWTALDTWLSPLPADGLLVSLRCRRPPQPDIHFTRWQILRHSLNHSTQHRGQVVGMLRALGKQPPNVDLFSYYLLNC
jgi:uncharacterized damage-inducible protein DinB